MYIRGEISAHAQAQAPIPERLDVVVGIRSVQRIEHLAEIFRAVFKDQNNSRLGLPNADSNLAA